MLFTLEMYDTNPHPSHPEGKGPLNADYATRMKLFLERYNDTANVDISKGYSKFDAEYELGDCYKFPYGYVAEEEGEAIKPCVYLKMNNIWSWKPKPIDAEDLPQSVEDNLQNLSETERQQIFLDCQGETGFDKEAVREGVTYIPKTKGFPLDSFPYMGNKEVRIGVRFVGLYHRVLMDSRT